MTRLFAPGIFKLAAIVLGEASRRASEHRSPHPSAIDLNLTFSGFVLAVIAALGSAAAHAQSTAAYPTKPVRLIIPYAPGGGTDLIGRSLAQKLTENLGQTVFVENRPGANGNLGMEAAAKSPADGYTLVYALFAQFAVNPFLYPKLAYDPVRDFAPITLLVRSPYVLVTHPSLPVKSTRELIALAKARPGQLVLASAGSGSGAHLAAEMLRMMTGIDFIHVGYKGAGPLLIDLVAGHTQFSFATWSSGGPHVKSGRLRGLAVTTAKRASALPDLPAISETVPGYDIAVWYGVVAPAGTPREIISRLNGEIVRVLAAPDFRQRIVGEAVEPIGSTPEQFADYIRTEMTKWSKVVKEAKVKID